MTYTDAQFSLFAYLPERCVDCVHFFRWSSNMAKRPNGWYRIDVGGCKITQKKVMMSDTCDRFEKAEVSYDELQDMHFIKDELTIDNFDEPEIQAQLDRIAEREMQRGR